ncbi:MAG: hypothetical protein GX552_12655 [Chloroflexi bacterium]|nr:hypothetical protein [Chloroflexota bacterium]
MIPTGAPPDLATLTGGSPTAYARYVGAVTVLFGLYLLGLYLASRMQGRAPVAIVIGCGVLSALALAGVYPYGASDLFLYVARGRVLGIHGYNSLVVPPNTFQDIAAYVPFPSEWVDFPSPYGPLWEWTAALLARLGDGSLLRSVLVFKLFNVGVYVACLSVIFAILRRRGREHILSGLVAFAWNPLVLLEAHAQGHNDLYMMLFVLLALWAWERSHHSSAIVLLVVGGLVKYVPFLLLPVVIVLLWRQVPTRVWLRTVGRGLLASLLLGALIFGPLWPGKDWGLLKQMAFGHNSVAAWLILTLDRVFAVPDAFQIGSWAMRLAFGGAYLWVIARAWREGTPAAQTCHRVLYAWLLLGALAFGYWYIVWLVVLASLLLDERERLRTIVFSWCGLVSVVLYILSSAWSDVINIQQAYSLIIPFVFGLPLLLAQKYGRWFQTVLHLAKQHR